MNLKCTLQRIYGRASSCMRFASPSRAKDADIASSASPRSIINRPTLFSAHPLYCNVIWEAVRYPR